MSLNLAHPVDSSTFIYDDSVLRVDFMECSVECIILANARIIHSTL